MSILLSQDFTFIVQGITGREAVNLAIGLVGFAFMHLTRGTLSGNGRFRPYGIILAIDGTAKLVAALVLWGLGVESAGAYAMCIALSPFVATGIALIGQHGLLEDRCVLFAIREPRKFTGHGVNDRDHGGCQAGCWKFGHTGEYAGRDCRSAGYS